MESIAPSMSRDQLNRNEIPHPALIQGKADLVSEIRLLDYRLEMRLDPVPEFVILCPINNLRGMRPFHKTFAGNGAIPMSGADNIFSTMTDYNFVAEGI